MPMPPEPSCTLVPASPTADDPVQHGFNELWEAALSRYRDQTGRELRELEFAEHLLSTSTTADEIIESFKKQCNSFKSFRANGRNIFTRLTMIVRIVLQFIDTTAEAASVRTSPAFLTRAHR
jgi:hypothetical protein